MLIIERTPFEKGASLKLSPENFRFVFFSDRAFLHNVMGFFIMSNALSEKKTDKSLWKGVWGITFPQKGFPHKNYNLLYRSCDYTACFYFSFSSCERRLLLSFLFTFGTAYIGFIGFDLLLNTTYA